MSRSSAPLALCWAIGGLASAGLVVVATAACEPGHMPPPPKIPSPNPQPPEFEPEAPHDPKRSGDAGFL